MQNLKKNGCKVFCKHIILSYFSCRTWCFSGNIERNIDDDLKIIFSEQVSHSFFVAFEKSFEKKQTQSEGNISKASRIQKATRNKITSQRIEKC